MFERTLLPRVLLAIVPWLAYSACVEEVSEGPVEAVVLSRSGPGEYALEPRELEVESLVPLRGAGLSFVEDATIVIDGSRERVEGGRPLGVPTVGDPHVAIDHEGLLALTAFANYEQGWAYFRGLGLGTTVEDMPPLEVYVFPRVVQQGAIVNVPFGDNAAFASTIHGFLVTQNRFLSGDVPLAMNPVVSTHELGHAVFYHLTVRTRGQGEPPPGFTQPHMRALNEGLADVFAIAQYVEPAGLGDSISPDSELFDPAERDVRLPWTFTREIETEADSALLSGSFSPYHLGTVVARTFWLYAQALASSADLADDRGLAGSLHRAAALAFDALVDFDVAHAAHVLDYFNHLLDGLGADAERDRDAMCAALAETFGRVFDQIGGCR